MSTMATPSAAAGSDTRARGSQLAAPAPPNIPLSNPFSNPFILWFDAVTRDHTSRVGGAECKRLGIIDSVSVNADLIDVMRHTLAVAERRFLLDEALARFAGGCRHGGS